MIYRGISLPADDRPINFCFIVPVTHAPADVADAQTIAPHTFQCDVLVDQRPFNLDPPPHLARFVFRPSCALLAAILRPLRLSTANCTRMNPPRFLQSAFGFSCFALLLFRVLIGYPFWAFVLAHQCPIAPCFPSTRPPTVYGFSPLYFLAADRARVSVCSRLARLAPNALSCRAPIRDKPIRAAFPASYPNDG